jgi:hypothetical protein
MAESHTSPDMVSRHLLEVSRLRRMIGIRRAAVDMSPRAVSARLRKTSELRDFCIALQKAGRESLGSR